MTAQPRNIWIPLLIAGIIGCGLLASMFFPPYMVWAGVMMALFGAILLGHPRRLLFGFWLWAAFQPLVSQISKNSAVRYAEEAFMAAMFAICAADYVRRRTAVRGTGGISKTFGALLAVTLASWLINRSSGLSAVNFVTTYLSFPFVFYVAYTTLDRRHWKYLFGAIIGLMLIQFAMNIGWRLGVNPLPNEWKGTGNFADLHQGTFGSCAVVAYFMISSIFMLISALRLDKKHRPWILLLLGMAVSQWYMTYTNHSYMLFILLFPIYLILAKASLRMRLSIGIIVLLGALIFVFLSSVDTNRSMSVGARSQLEDNFDRQNLERRWENFTQGPKVELITRIAIKNATRDPYLWLLGNGPGSGLSAIGMAKGSDFAWEYLGEFVQSTDAFKGRGMTSITGSFYSGILSVWSDVGVLGYVLYMALYIQLLLHVVLRLIKNQYTEPVQRVLAEGFVMGALLFMMLSFMGDVFYLKYFAGGLWILAAMVWDPVEPEDGEQPSSPKATPSHGRTDDKGLRKAEALNQKNSKTAPVANGWQRPPLRK